MDIIIPIATLGILGFIFGMGLTYALKVFSSEEDPRVVAILSVLPGANCGACGMAGCHALAEAIASGKAEITKCAPGGPKVREKLAELLGIEVKHTERFVATLLCNGGKKARDKHKYSGPKTCALDNVYSLGHKACSFGCLGWGDCVNACPFGAIEMGDDELPIVDEKKCTACGRCLKACPKNLYELTPFSKRIYVKCKSTDKGYETAKVCKGGCIACLRCEKACKFDAIHVTNNLSKINYTKCVNARDCVKVCPTKVIFDKGNVAAGVPSSEKALV